MKPSELCIQHGLKSLAELSRMSGTSQRTLINWFDRYPQRFQLLVMGAALRKNQNKSANKSIVTKTNIEKHIILMEEMLNSNNGGLVLTMLEAEELIKQYCRHNQLMHECFNFSKCDSLSKFKVFHR